MRLLPSVIALLVLSGQCGTPPQPIEFLPRKGCVQTKMMQVRTETAIKDLALSNPYAVVDLDTLPATDTRRGYPTPTVLIGGVDLFGMPTPTPPFPEPT